MPIPDFQTLMLPLLEALADGQKRLMRDVTAQLADRFELTEEERQQKLPSGENRLFVNRVAWAKAHLKAAGPIDNLRRRGGRGPGHWQGWRRRHRRCHQGRQAGPGRGLPPGPAVGEQCRAAGGAGIRRQHGLRPDYVERIEGKKVVLIGGERLAELMIEHGVGVTTAQVYELKEVSNDFFDEDEG
jgi:restriction endonuclease Mrr